MPIDPVCGLLVAKEHAAVCSDFRGKHYCFCCEECKEEFDRDPDPYLTGSADESCEEENL